MAYGTPASRDHIAEYYTHIRRGRAPAPDQLADLVRRYDAIGGVSPMRRRTDEQVAAIEGFLTAGTTTTGDTGFEVRLGQKHAAPFIEDAVDSLVASGVTRIVGLVLAPHYSAASVGQYHDRARAALLSAVGAIPQDPPAGRQDIPYLPIDDWSTLPGFIDFTAGAVRRALDGMPARTMVCFTAHSLPLRVLEQDPYESRLAASADAIAAAAGIRDSHRVTTGWQSAGRTPEPWAGPDILETIADAASDPALDGLLVVPQGFTSDHLEVLFDLDIEARTAASDAGLVFSRTETINDDPEVMAGLARLITERIR